MHCRKFFSHDSFGFDFLFEGIIEASLKSKLFKMTLKKEAVQR